MKIPWPVSRPLECRLLSIGRSRALVERYVPARIQTLSRIFFVNSVRALYTWALRNKNKVRHELNQYSISLCPLLSPEAPRVKGRLRNTPEPLRHGFRKHRIGPKRIHNGPRLLQNDLERLQTIPEWFRTTRNSSCGSTPSDLVQSGYTESLQILLNSHILMLRTSTLGVVGNPRDSRAPCPSPSSTTCLL